MTTRVVAALGANLGDRRANLLFGLRELASAGFTVDRCSSVYETPPIGYLEQSPFLNLVVLGGWGRGPQELMVRCRQVEEAAGRVRAFPNAPRPLDIDLVFFGSTILRHPAVRIPHPRWKGRSFVVRPLMEVAPEVRDPETGLLVSEVAARWPLEPTEIRIAEEASRFCQTLVGEDTPPILPGNG